MPQIGVGRKGSELKFRLVCKSSPIFIQDHITGKNTKISQHCTLLKPEQHIVT